MVPPAKKQKTLHDPISTTRTCAVCNEVKETQSFSKNQRRKGANAKCIDCCTQQKECSDYKKPKSRGAYGEDQRKHHFPKEQEDEIRRLEQLECERREKEEFEKESISRALELKNKSGCVCYKLPPDWEVLPFRDSPPCDICGDYNVIFQGSFSSEGAEERTTRGKLVLKEQDGLLHGRVDIDEDIPVGAGYHFNANFNFDEMPTKNAQHSEKIWSTEFVVTGLDANVELEFRPEGDEVIPATLKVLDKRIGLPWLMDENYYNLDECVPFKFDTLEEAEFIAKKANDHIDSWLCNHLGMSAYVAKHIHEFVAWRPDPVFFLEPGDLILHVEWSEDFREGAASLLVARKATNGDRAST
jgi:hypothetical protein